MRSAAPIRAEKMGVVKVHHALFLSVYSIAMVVLAGSFGCSFFGMDS